MKPGMEDRDMIDIGHEPRLEPTEEILELCIWCGGEATWRNPYSGRCFCDSCAAYLAEEQFEKMDDEDKCKAVGMVSLV